MKKEFSPQEIRRLADFSYAVAMLKKLPRSGFAFLGSGSESIADHSFGAATIGYTLAVMAGADITRTVLLCLFHDLHEAATGDFNYVNHRYDQCDAQKALEDICADTGLGDVLLAQWREFEDSATLEAQLARDADQLDLVCALRRELATGNNFAAEWLTSAVQRIRTDAGKRLCEAIMTTEPHHWWYNQADKNWWIDRKPDNTENKE